MDNSNAEIDGTAVIFSMQKSYHCKKHGEIGGAICQLISGGIKGLETVYPVTMCAFCYADHLRTVVGEVAEIAKGMKS
jgi:hypothetical protein